MDKQSLILLDDYLKDPSPLSLCGISYKLYEAERKGLELPLHPELSSFVSSDLLLNSLK